MTARIKSLITIATVSIMFACTHAQPATTAEKAETDAENTAPTAQLRSASFITSDLDASVKFYTEYLGYYALGTSEIEAEKSRAVVGAKGDARVRYASLAPAMWSKENSTYAGVSFIEIEGAEGSPFDQDGTRASRAGELVLAHRVTNIDEIARRMDRRRRARCRAVGPFRLRQVAFNGGSRPKWRSR